MAIERLQKILAKAGLGSRRACEELIRAGRVHVNGTVAKLGDKADRHKDEITLDFEPLPETEALVYVALHKPRGVESTLQSQSGLQTVSDLVALDTRLYPVGRLDVDSEGLILMTNDGELTDRLTHPRYQSEKEYEVLLRAYPREEQLEIWRRGVVLPDTGEKTASAKVQIMSKGASGTWLRVVMHEGKRHQIRRIADTLGLPVKRIKRVRIASLRLGGLAAGDWRHLTQNEVNTLRREKSLRRVHPPKPASRQKWKSQRQRTTTGSKPAGKRNTRTTSRRQSRK